MVPDQETGLSLEEALGLAQEVKLLLRKIPIVQDLSADRADQMKLVIRLVAPPVLVSYLSTRALDLAEQTSPVQQVEGAVDGRNSNVMTGRLEQDIDLLGTEMLSVSMHEDSENLLTKGELRYLDHIGNYLEFLISFGFGKLSLRDLPRSISLPLRKLVRRY